MSINFSFKAFAVMLVLFLASCNGAALSVETQSVDPRSNVSKPSSDEVFIQGSVESLGVFKNGVAAVRERYHVSNSGRFSVIAPPTAIHGAFFVESDVPIETFSSSSEVVVPIEGETIDWTTDFKDKLLAVTLPGEKEPRTVRVVQRADETSDFNVNAVSSTAFYGRMATPFGGKGVLLECENGDTIWLADSSAVSSVVVKGGAPTTLIRKKPRLIFNVQDVDPVKGATIWLSYLTRGISWAPQYRLILKDEQNIEIEQSAILINDWRDFSEAPTFLYSGFPQIIMQNAISPMSPGVDLTQFFASLNAGSSNNAAAMSQMVLNSAMQVDAQRFPTLPTLDSDSDSGGVDIFAQGVGDRTLKKGERVLFNIDKKTTPYQRFVRWDIYDSRDSTGRNVGSVPNSSSYGTTTSGSGGSDLRCEEPWDVVLFRNPFTFPLTTGPASAYAPDRFLGQSSMYWRSPGEETLLPITKALGVRVSSRENERNFNPDSSSNSGSVVEETHFDEQAYLAPSLKPNLWGRVIPIRSEYYRYTVVDATIELNNLRNEETVMDVVRQFTGVAVPDSFEGFNETPEILCLNSFGSDFRRRFNPANEMKFRVTLKPLEKRILKFSYQILTIQ
ncbi:MAG: hypothetical protein ACOX0A_04095 [Thermoguttaceae bacterium]